MLSEIQRLWDDHTGASYPDDYRGEEVAGVDLVLLDADIAGCVGTFLTNRGQLDEPRLAILGLCLRDAARVQQELVGYAQSYFARLERLAALVLGFIARSQRQA